MNEDALGLARDTIASYLDQKVNVTNIVEVEDFVGDWTVDDRELLLEAFREACGVAAVAIHDYALIEAYGDAQDVKKLTSTFVQPYIDRELAKFVDRRRNRESS